MFGSNKDLGFLKYVDEDNDVEGSVKEVWERNCLQQPLVRGTTVYIRCTCIIEKCSFCLAFRGSLEIFKEKGCLKAGTFKTKYMIVLS